MSNAVLEVVCNAVVNSFTVSTEALATFGNKVGEAVGKGISSATSKVKDDVEDFREKRKRGPDDAENSVMNALKGYVSAMKGEKGDSDKERSANQSQAFQKTAAFLQKGVGMLIMIGQKSFDVIKQILNRLKASSPLLQAIESLFNLAMTLFFMPLGNKLATVLLPAVLELVDSMVDMWDELGDGGIDEIFNKAMDYGVRKFADFFGKIADLFEKSDNSFLRAIGSLSKMIEQLIPIVKPIVDLASWVVDNIPLLIGAIVGLLGTIITLKITSMIVQATMGMGPIGTVLALGIIASATAGIGVAAGLSGMLNQRADSNSNMADGGYVPPREGGTWKRLGEAGEGEYVVPERKFDDVINSKLSAGNRGTPYRTGSAEGASLGATITNNFYINGYTDADLQRIIRDTVDEQVQLAAIKGGF